MHTKSITAMLSLIMADQLAAPGVKHLIAEGFGLEAMHIQKEAKLEAALAHGLKVVNEEERPFCSMCNCH